MAQGQRLFEINLLSLPWVDISSLKCWKTVYIFVLQLQNQQELTHLVFLAPTMKSVSSCTPICSFQILLKIFFFNCKVVIFGNFRRFSAIFKKSKNILIIMLEYCKLVCRMMNSSLFELKRPNVSFCLGSGAMMQNTQQDIFYILG